MLERWVVISNCQTFGLANSIETSARDVTCEACDLHRFREVMANDPDRYRGHDLALVLPEVQALPEFDAARLPSQAVVPAVQFSAYHPDCVYVRLDGALFTAGPLGAYHSMIALAAYKEGLAAEQAVRFYDPAVYRAAGYLDVWDRQKRGLVDLFAGAGLDVAAAFPRWGRGRPFMHTVNHPRMAVLHDIARAVLTSRGREMFPFVDRPPDNLAALTWPVYPEIGEALGVPGAYLFQTNATAKPLALLDFVAASLHAFAPYDRSRLRVIRSLERSLQAVRRIMREEAG